jgi:hypothetical protein
MMRGMSAVGMDSTKGMLAARVGVGHTCGIETMPPKWVRLPLMRITSWMASAEAGFRRIMIKVAPMAALKIRLERRRRWRGISHDLWMRGGVLI